MSTRQTSPPSPPDSSDASTPKRKKPSQPRATQQDPVGSPEELPEGPAPGESTGDYLENIVRQVLDISLNAKDLSHPLLKRHFSPDFRGKHDALPPVSNSTDHSSSLKVHLDKQPNFRVTVLNTSSEVDDSRGRATVYIWYEISGLAGGLERENVSLLTWERKGGIWLITKHQGMRGPSGFFR